MVKGADPCYCLEIEGRLHPFLGTLNAILRSAEGPGYDASMPAAPPRSALPNRYRRLALGRGPGAVPVVEKRGERSSVGPQRSDSGLVVCII